MAYGRTLRRTLDRQADAETDANHGKRALRTLGGRSHNLSASALKPLSKSVKPHLKRMADAADAVFYLLQRKCFFLSLRGQRH
jgi:hypothetical protein